MGVSNNRWHRRRRAAVKALFIKKSHIAQAAPPTIIGHEINRNNNSKRTNTNIAVLYHQFNFRKEYKPAMFVLVCMAGLRACPYNLAWDGMKTGVIKSGNFSAVAPERALSSGSGCQRTQRSHC